MITWATYFEAVGVLLLIYGVVRTLIWMEYRMETPRTDGEDEFRRVQRLEPPNMESHAIDATQLKQRVEEARRDFVAEARMHPSVTNKPLLVEERRQEIAKLAFFQKPPPEAEISEKEHGAPLLLAL